MPKPHDNLRERVVDALTPDRVIDIVQRLGFHPRREGREYKILCPFHNDSKPSFCINPTKNTQASAGGIFKCFSCGWGASDIFAFVEEAAGIAGGFRPTLEYVASMLGIVADKGVRIGQKPVPKREAQARLDDCPVMTPAEVYAHLEAFRANALDPAKYLEQMGLDPRAVVGPLGLGGVIAPVSKRGRDPRPAMIVPMRRPTGELCSLRIRLFEKSSEGKTIRFSLDEERRATPEEVAADKHLRWVQTKRTESGLIVPQWVLEEPPAPFQVTLLVEGETDESAGLTMMLREFGEDPVEWPARFIGLPGVGACHDMLVASILSGVVITFMDPDAAGLGAVFDRRRRICTRCGRAVIQGRECTRRECDRAEAVLSLDEPPIPGLLSKMRALERQAMAAFPPIEATKVDLRDLVNRGWGWNQFWDHCRRTGTADPSESNAMKIRARLTSNEVVV